MPASMPTGEPLTGPFVRLDALRIEDADGMLPLLADPQVYRQGYVMHGPPASVDDARAMVRRRFLKPGRFPYAVRLAGDSDLGPAGTLVGTSALADIDLDNERIHLGSTLYGSRWWATFVNPATKLLLLEHAFTDCGFGRVKIQTDLLNQRSQAAIARLGAVREGVLRRHMVREDGTFRDSVIFSILRDEWPGVRAGLLERLERLERSAATR